MENSLSLYSGTYVVVAERSDLHCRIYPETLQFSIMTIRFVLQNRTKFLGLLPREFWGFFCREPNFACLDLNKNSYHKIVTIALQAFSCLQAVSPFLTPALMSLASKFNILTLLSYCMLAIWGPGNFIDYVFKYHIVCITNIFTNRVNRVVMSLLVVTRVGDCVLCNLCMYHVLQFLCPTICLSFLEYSMYIKLMPWAVSIYDNHSC